MRIARHFVPWLAWWAACFWLWLLLVGEWNRIELVAAAIAATVAATFGEFARSRAGARARLPLAWVARAWNVPVMLLVDFAIVVWALVASAARREVVRGTFVTRDFRAGGSAASASGIRAWAALTASYSPNAYVVDIDAGTNAALLHDLVPFRRSEEPVA